MASVDSSKSHRFVDFLPSIRPSFLSLVVLFACGCLWMKNETTNERLRALESRINMSPVEVLVKTGCLAMENDDRTTLNPQEESAKNLLKNLQRPVDEVKLKDTSENNSPLALYESGESRTKAKPRNRRQVLNATSAGISIHDVRKEISKQFEQLMPTKYCKSSEKVCPVGPPGLPGPTGVRGPRGRRGPKGKKGPQGLKGPPGKSGQRGMTGPAGLRGEKGDKGEPGPKAVQGPPGSPGKTGMTGLTGPRGDKGDKGGPGPKGMPGTPGRTGKTGMTGLTGPRGDKGDKGGSGPKGMPGPPGRTGKTGMTGLTGPRGDKGDKGGPGTKGMPGPPGRPGESISTPQLIISPTDQTKDERSNSVIYCTVRGNPTPSVEWRFKSRKLYSGAKYLVKEGELVVRNLNYGDAGQYTCVARNILGTSEASGNLKVRGLPIFTKRPSSLVSKMEFFQIQETCQAEGYPPPKLTWIRLVMPLPTGKTEVKEGKLTIRNLRPVDSGLYQCVATNSLGTKKATMNLVVTAAACKVVGVEDPNKIPNAWMTASSDAGTNFKSYNGRVNMKNGWYRWCPSSFPDRSDYLQVDIGAVRYVCAVATQKRHSTEYTRTYYLRVSVDGVNWKTYEENKAKKVFQASTVLYSVVQQKLSQVVKARFVRFFPITYTGNRCLAVEIYVLT